MSCGACVETLGLEEGEFGLRLTSASIVNELEPEIEAGGVNNGVGYCIGFIVEVEQGST